MKTLISIAITMMISVSAWAKPGNAVSSNDFNAMIQESRALSKDLGSKLKDQVGTVDLKKEKFGKINAENRTIETATESIASPTSDKYLQKDISDTQTAGSVDRVSQEVKDVQY